MKTLVFMTCALLSSFAFSQEINCFKDELFTLKGRQVIEAKYNGSWKRYFWDEMQDVNGRDAVPGQRAKPERVDLTPLGTQKDVQFKFPGGQINAYEVGEPKNAKFAMIFIHGGGGSRELGVSDYSFGGNFNRLKNLATRNGGVYYSPTVSFDSQGDKGVLEIIKKIKENSPNAKIAISCGSAGAHTCWRMAESPEASSMLSGIVFVGGAQAHHDIENTQAFIKEVPMIFSHGKADRLVPWNIYDKQFEEVIKSKPNYPSRFELYEGGKHGTPMRMIDWCESMNWMFSQSSKIETGTESKVDSKSKDKNRSSGVR